MAAEPELNDRSRIVSEAQQIDEALQLSTKALAVLGLELAQQSLFQLRPVIGEAIADADTAVSQRNARSQFGTHGLTSDQFALDQALESWRQSLRRDAELGGKGGFCHAGAAQLE